MSSGYSKTPLARKLGIKPGHTVLFIGEPAYYLSLFEYLPEVAVASGHSQNIDFIHLFAHDFEVLNEHFGSLRQRLAKDGILWVSWPKKSSNVVTDLDGNLVRQYGLEHGLVDVKVCAVDDIWSGLKFMYRKKDRK